MTGSSDTAHQPGKGLKSEHYSDETGQIGLWEVVFFSELFVCYLICFDGVCLLPLLLLLFFTARFYITYFFICQVFFAFFF